MINLWNLLWYGHDHKWEELSYLNFIDTSYGCEHNKHYVTYRCEICKKHKREVAEGFR